MALRGGYKELQKPFFVKGFTRRFQTLGHALSYAQSVATAVSEPVTLEVFEWDEIACEVRRDELGSITTHCYGLT